METFFRDTLMLQSLPLLLPLQTKLSYHAATQLEVSTQEQEARIKRAGTLGVNMTASLMIKASLDTQGSENTD